MYACRLSHSKGGENMTNTYKKGFTLIELLVVIAIIGLLSTLAIVALGSARQRARDSQRLSDLRQIQTALELYYTENSNYPTVALPTVLGAGLFACLNTSGWAATGCASPFMSRIPADPGNNSYAYSSANGSTYTINATLEGTVNNLTAAIQASPSGIVDILN